MIDLHSHVLPGFDDGAEDWPMAVEMCSCSSSDGVRGIVATPHFFRGLFPTPEVESVHGATAELQRLCEESSLPEFKIYLGGDCHLHPEILANVKEGRVPTINGSRYLLLELPDGALPHRIKDVIFEMSVAGITPIITHPERHEVLSRHPSLLYELICGGAYAQVTAQSLTGFFGSTTQRAAEAMVSNGLVQIIASDGHDPRRRPPVLSPAVDATALLVGREIAEQMVNDVPNAVLKNEPIVFPEPMSPGRKRKTPFWRRVLKI